MRKGFDIFDEIVSHYIRKDEIVISISTIQEFPSHGTFLNTSARNYKIRDRAGQSSDNETKVFENKRKCPLTNDRIR